MIWEGWEDYCRGFDHSTVDQRYFFMTSPGTTRRELVDFLREHPQYAEADEVIWLANPHHFDARVRGILRRYQRAINPILRDIYTTDEIKHLPEEGGRMNIGHISEMAKHYVGAINFIVSDYDKLQTFPRSIRRRAGRARSEYKKFRGLIFQGGGQ